MEKTKIRYFNLLFLEEDEEYMDDMLITMKKKENGNFVNKRGRLRLCSRSLVFEPYNIDDDVLKFPFRKLENIKLNAFKNELIVRTVELIKIKTIIYNKKTRCISQFAYERQYKKTENMINDYNEYYNEFKNINNDNIDEKIKEFEKILNNFDEYSDDTNTSNNMVKDNINLISDKVGGINIQNKKVNDNNTTNSYMYIFTCENSPGMTKKLNHIYDILIKIKIAMLIHEKQMEILIKEKKNKQAKNYNSSNNNTLNKNNRKEINLEKYIEDIIEKLTINIKFDISSINIHEKIISNKIEGYWVFKVSPLLKVKGILNITNKYIYFQPNPNFTNKKEKKWQIKNIVHVFKRIITMKPNALEIIFYNEKKKYNSLYIEFISFDERQMIINVLKRIKPQCFFIEENKEFIYLIQEKWINGFITNYEYLDFLNCVAGRSRKDFSQYPVFPWILSDYSSEKINLNDENVYRNLSKPIGCLNENRLNSLIEKMQDHEYFYGSHYSTLAYVVYFLIRLYPECQLKLQSGKFDTLSRMFLSIESTFNTALNANSSFIEILPEFYEDDDSFLKNNLNINTCEGNINDVILPKWCNNSKNFLIIMKNALESNYVNQHLNEWIDLIFGYKQNGKIAKENFNLFHPLTYMHAILNEKISSEYNIDNEKKKTGEDTQFDKNFNHKIKSLIISMSPKALKTQLHEFGQCPFQIFKERHPPKKKIKKFYYDEKIKNFPWYYSSIINEMLKEEYLKKNEKKKKKSNKNSKNILNNQDKDEYSDENISENFDDEFTLNNENNKKKKDFLTRKISHMNDDNNYIKNINKREKEKYYDYFKRYNWELHKSDNIPCNIKGVSNNQNNICFACKNGYIKLITFFDILNYEIKDNKNLISLKLSNENFSCVTDFLHNYILGTINGNIVFLNPQSILKTKKCIKKDDKNTDDKIHKNKIKNENKNKTNKDASIFSDYSNISLDDSSNSLFSSFDEIFEYDSLYERSKNKRKEFIYNDNIYNKLIIKKIHNDTINCMNSNDNYLVTGSSDETLQLINIENNFEIIQTYDNFSYPVKYVQLKGKLLFTRSDNFKLFDIRTPKKKIHLNNLNNNKIFLNISSNESVPLINNEQSHLFCNSIKEKVYDENYIHINYINPQYLFEKRIKKNINSVFTKNFDNIIYSSIVNDYIILCVDKKNNFYFYDIKSENWHNIISKNLNQTKKKEIISASSNKQQLCSINKSGEIFLEHISFCNNCDNNNTSKTNFFNTNSSIIPSYISFLNYYDLEEMENYDLCNYILLTGINGNIEIFKKIQCD
ncbi:neutral-sphingomyelinase activation factor protein, putative [Plasmodium gallinaceum]|uniref:Neutral-sphingomyelinase activation factor protein, putative n=1 Tax=Plasmodium gallinaceum TaxID=5849 RepID=A0A1J1GUR9_PLAGA|nr:neutral-sphingomyelinase activation factor protein, putative [Plasmodium gallinaceum]CRG96289.1 neutral-sphingomyelinase activation factor protein, putative [Plasmodium gallinaceum]